MLHEGHRMIKLLLLELHTPYLFRNVNKITLLLLFAQNNKSTSQTGSSEDI